MGAAATGNVRINRVEKALLKFLNEMQNLERGSSDVATKTNTKSSVTFVRWKNNKVVTKESSMI